MQHPSTVSASAQLVGTPPPDDELEEEALLELELELELELDAVELALVDELDAAVLALVDELDAVVLALDDELLDAEEPPVEEPPVAEPPVAVPLDVELDELLDVDPAPAPLLDEVLVLVEAAVRPPLPAVVGRPPVPAPVVVPNTPPPEPRSDESGTFAQAPNSGKATASESTVIARMRAADLARRPLSTRNARPREANHPTVEGAVRHG